MKKNLVSYLLIPILLSVLMFQLPTLVSADTPPEIEWQRTFGSAQEDYCVSIDHSGNGYVIAASSYSYGPGISGLWLIKTDSEGNPDPAWINADGSIGKTFGSNSSDYAWQVRETQHRGGGYFVCGYKGSTQDVWLIKTDYEGDPDPAWINADGSIGKTFGGNNLDLGLSFCEIEDGYMVLAGVKTQF